MEIFCAVPDCDTPAHTILNGTALCAECLSYVDEVDPRLGPRDMIDDIVALLEAEYQEAREAVAARIVEVAAEALRNDDLEERAN
jgi:hypothetical protein